MKKTQKTALTAAMFAAVLNFTGCGDKQEQPASQVTAPETQAAVSETQIVTETETEIITEAPTELLTETETEIETIAETPAQEDYQPSHNITPAVYGPPPDFEQETEANFETIDPVQETHGASLVYGPPAEELGD